MRIKALLYVWIGLFLAVPLIAQTAEKLPKKAIVPWSNISKRIESAEIVLLCLVDSYEEKGPLDTFLAPIMDLQPADLAKAPGLNPAAIKIYIVTCGAELTKRAGLLNTKLKAELAPGFAGAVYLFHKQELAEAFGIYADKQGDALKTSLLALFDTQAAPVPEAPAEEPLENPFNGKVIISAATDYKGDPSDFATDEIYLIFADGSREYLTDNKVMDRAISFSPDNKHLAFYRKADTDKNGKLDWADTVSLMFYRLTDKKEITIKTGMLHPPSVTWDIQKNYMLYSHVGKTKTPRLYQYDLKTGKEELLKTDFKSWPVLSGDGKYLAFYNKKNGVEIKSMVGNFKRVLHKDVGNGWNLYWSHDNKLVFTVIEAGKRTWKVFDANNRRFVEMTNAERMKLKQIDTKQYGWAEDLEK